MPSPYFWLNWPRPIGDKSHFIAKYRLQTSAGQGSTNIQSQAIQPTALTHEDRFSANKLVKRAVAAEARDIDELDVDR